MDGLGVAVCANQRSNASNGGAPSFVSCGQFSTVRAGASDASELQNKQFVAAFLVVRPNSDR